MKPLAECVLYTFVDTAYLRERNPAEVARQLCQGGSDLIQLRAKNIPSDTVCRMAENLLPITRAAEVGLVINDHLEVAARVGAEFCHLGQEDFFGSGYQRVSELAQRISSVRIGLSTHAPTQAARAVAAGADYVAIGPVYSTATKPAAQPVTLEYVRWASANLSVPWFAIGGINLENLDHVLAAGARRICVVSAILQADDVAGACRKLRKRIEAAR
jgi:thiamine-phosphate pyrophosphorylase